MDKCKNKKSETLIEHENINSINNTNNANKDTDKQKEQAEILDMLMKEMTDMKQKQEHMQDKIIKLESENTQLKTKLTKKTTVKGNRVNGNLVNGDMNTNTQNTVNNIHNDIKIIAYGKEDLSFITDDNYRLLLNKGFKSVQNLVEYIHLNQNKPENQNIYVSNMRDNYVLIFDGNQWQLKERDDVLQEMIENKTDILSEKFDELIKTLDESTIKKFKRFLDEKDEDRVVEQIKKELKLILYNKKLIKELPARIGCSDNNKQNIYVESTKQVKSEEKSEEKSDKPKEVIISTYKKRKTAIK